MPPPSPSTEYLALGGSLGPSTPCPPRRSTVKRTPQYRRAPPSACRQPLPPSSTKRRRKEDAPGSFGAAARPLPEPRVLPFGGGRNKRPVSPSGVPLLDGEHVDTNDHNRGSQGKNKKKPRKVRLALRVPGKGGASRLVSLGKGVSSAFLSAVTRSRGGKPVPSEARLPPTTRPEHETRGEGAPQHAAPVDTDAHVAALDGETFIHRGPNFFAPIGNTGVTGVTDSEACSPDHQPEVTAAGAHCTVLGWSCLLALAGSLSLLMGDGARIVVTYCSDDDDESDEAEEAEEEEYQSEGDLCSVPDVDGAHSLDEFIDDDYLAIDHGYFGRGEVEIGGCTSASDVLALGALGMLLGGRAPRAVAGARRQGCEDRKQVVWGGDEEASLPSIDGADEESSLPSIDGGDESSLPSVYEAEEASLPSLDGEEDDGLGDLPAFDARPEVEEAGPRTSASEVASLSLLGMLLGSPAPRCVPSATDRGNTGAKVVWEDDDGASLPSIDGARDDSSLPCIEEGDDASIPSMDGEGDDLGDLPTFDASPDEQAGPRTSATEVAGLSLLGMFLGSPAPRCLSSANDGGNTGAKVVWEEDDCASLPSIDGARDDSSLPCIEEGDDASIPSMDGEGDDLGDLPTFDASPDEQAGPRTSATEVAGLSLLGMFLGSPAPRCLSSANDGGNTGAKAVWEDDCASLPSIDGADDSSLPCIEEGDDASIPSLDGESDDVVADLPSSDSSLTEEGAGPTTSASEVAGLSLLGMLLGSPAPSCVPAGPARRKGASTANLWDDCGEAEDLDGILPDCQAAPAPEEPRLNAAVFSLVPSLSGTSDDDSAEDDSRPPSMDGAGPSKGGPAASPLSSSPDDVMAWGTLVAILSSPAPSPVKGSRRASGARSLWEDCDVPLPPEL